MVRSMISYVLGLRTRDHGNLMLMVVLTGVNGADSERQSVTANYQAASDVSVHRSNATMQGAGSQVFQLGTARSSKKRFVSFSLC